MNKEVERLKEMLKEIEGKKETKEEGKVLIHADRKSCQIQGSLADIMTELTIIIKEIKNEIGVDKEMFERSVDLAFMDSEELDDELEKQLKKTFDNFTDMLRGILDE